MKQIFEKTLYSLLSIHRSKSLKKSEVSKNFNTQPKRYNHDYQNVLSVAAYQYQLVMPVTSNLTESKQSKRLPL